MTHPQTHPTSSSSPDPSPPPSRGRGGDEASSPFASSAVARQAAALPIVRLVAVLLLAYLVQLLSSLLIPLAAALLLTFLLRPPVHRLASLIRLPHGVSAGLVLTLFLGVAGSGGFLLASPAAEWAQRAPRSLEELRAKLAVLREHTEALARAQSELEQLARSAESSETPEEVVVRGPTLSGILLGQVREFGVGLGAVLILLYFLLAASDTFVRKTVESVSQFREQRRMIETLREIEDDISIYLGTITAINLALGVVTAFALRALGVPNPVFWGAVAGMLNFVPYLGGIVTFGILSMVSLLSFDTLAYAVLPPLVFLGLNAIEGFLVTPHILGRRLLLNPVVVLLNLFFWTWAWGPSGALLSAPLLVVFRAIAQRVPSLRAFSLYVSG